MNLTRNDILNAFTPSHEVQEPELFAGRKKQLLSALEALHESQAVPLVYGERGLGKSSLAVQLGLIARGDDRLLQILDAQNRALPPHLHHTVVYIPCTKQTTNKDGMLQLAINALQKIEVRHRKGAWVVEDRISKASVGPQWLRGEWEESERFVFAGSAEDYSDLTVEEKLVSIASRLTEAIDHPVLIIFDELDLVEDTSGLAEFLRNASTRHLRFALVGIASDHASLLADHESLGRKLRPVRVPVMEPREMVDIFVKVIERLRHRGWALNFEAQAVVRLIILAGGYPWFMHIVGKETLVELYDDQRDTLEEDDVQRAQSRLLDNQFAEQYAARYRRAIKNSRARELVLRAYAMDQLVEVNTPLWNARLKQVGVKDPNVYKRQLEDDGCGAVLVRVDGDKRAVRFIDEIFKAYVRLVRPLHVDLKGKLTQLESTFDGA